MRDSSKLNLNLGATGWIRDIVAECLNLDSTEIDGKTPLGRYGLDSLAAIQVAGMVSEKLKRPVPDSLLRTYQTLQALESYIKLVQCGTGAGALQIEDRGDQLSPALLDCRFPADVQPG